MKHTSLSSYATASLDASGWTTVYQANQTISATGWVDFVFSTPFVYNGTSNLLIDFSHNNSSSTSSGYVRSTVPGGTRTAYAYSNSAYGDPLLWTGTTSPTVSGSTSVPNVRLTTGVPVAITPTSVTFAAGVWTGDVTVLQTATAMSLRADDGAGQVGTSNSFDVTIDTIPPTVVGVTAGDPLVTDADVGQNKFAVTVAFSEPMAASPVPTLTFIPAVDSTLAFAGGVWTDTTHYTATYHVADANLDVDNVQIGVTGAKDLTGNAQADYTPQNEFEIDTLNPTVQVNSLRTRDTTPAITGTVSDGTLQVAVNGKTYTAGDGNLTVNGTNWTLQIPAGDALPLGTYEVAATATDAAGNTGTDSTHNELQVVRLIVTSLTPTRSGFVAELSRELKLQGLNLYDGAGGALGGADVILQNGAGQAVAGSLVVAANGQAIEFVKFGGVLAPDTYTVTLKSGLAALPRPGRRTPGRQQRRHARRRLHGPADCGLIHRPHRQPPRLCPRRRPTGEHPQYDVGPADPHRQCGWGHVAGRGPGVQPRPARDHGGRQGGGPAGRLGRRPARHEHARRGQDPSLRNHAALGHRHRGRPADRRRAGRCRLWRVRRFCNCRMSR